MSQHTVNSIYQDEFGFIWVGTLDGLNRYDGSAIKVFKPVQGDSLSICENNIRYICGDRNGHLYIKGLESISVYDIRKNTFRVLHDRGVTACCWKNGMLWLAIGDAVFTYDLATERLTPFCSLPVKSPRTIISAMTVAGSGELYLSTALHGFYHIGAKGEFISQINMSEANLVMEDSRGEIWAATRNEGLYRLRSGSVIQQYKKDETREGSLIHNNVRCVCEDKEGNLFVGTYDGLCHMNRDSGVFTEYSYPFLRTVMPNRSILTMTLDHQGTLWIGTFYEGLQYYNAVHDIYTYYEVSSKGGITSSVISSMTEDDHGVLWLGTEGGGINAYDRKSGNFSAMRIEEGLSSNVVKSLYYEPGRDVLWVATLYHGMNRIDLKTGRIEKMHKKVYHKGYDIGYAQNIVKIIPAGDSLLLATNKGAVMMDKLSGRMTKLDVGVVEPRRAQIWDICYDTKGNMWLASSTDLYCVRSDMHVVKRYPFREIAESTANNYMRCILCDSRGRIWFGSSGSGLFLYNEERDSFINYNTAAGLDNGYITTMVEQRNGAGLYVATNSGLSSFDFESRQFVNYGRSMAFHVMGISENGLYMTHDGEIFACGHKGLVSVRDESLRHVEGPSQIFITDIHVNNTVAEPNDPLNGILEQSPLYQKKVILRPRHSVISFAFTQTDYLNTRNANLEYMLQGFDRDFIPAAVNNTATYTNLNPGRYTFVVRKVPAYEGTEYSSDAISILVRPPFYKAPWFFAAWLGIVAALTYYLFRSYIQRVRLRSSLESETREKLHIERINQSKMQFFTNISHEFRTPLTLMGAQMEMLLQRNDIRPSIYSSILSVYNNSRRLYRLVDEVLDLRRQEQGFMKLYVCRRDIIEFLHEIYLSFDNLAKLKGIDYSFSASEGPVDICFDSTQIERVAFNLLSNAFKYTPKGGRIEMSVRDIGREVEITVVDNGVGIQPTHIERIFDRFYQEESANSGLQRKGSGVGLSLTRSIVEMHGGCITATSTPGERTCFMVVLCKELVEGGSKIEVVEQNSSVERYITNTEEYTEVVTGGEPAIMDGKWERGVRILIVEDNDDVREILVRIFEPIYEVREASDGRRGIALARECEPDIILSDIMMPEMSGIEMCRMLKSDFQTCHIPVVLLTARSAEEYKIEGLLTGADDYIIKPFNVRLLVARCNNLVSGRRRLQQKYANEPDASLEILSTNPMDSELLRRAVETVERNIDNPNFDITLFAREMGLNRTYLFSKIKGLVGQTPNEFVTNIRLKKAGIALISQPTTTVSEIAYDLGFNSSSYFIKCFRTMYGLSPAAYRKEHLK